MSFSGPQAEAVAVERNAGFWRSLLDAVRGVRADYTSIPIGRAIVLLAVPMVLEMAMESLFALVDIFWVGRLGADATAAVGSTESLFALVYAVAIGLAMGTTALVARRIGEKKEEQADLAAVQAIVLAMLASLPIALVGIVFGSGVLRLVDAADSVVVAGSGFTRTVLVANATVMLLHVINAIFRAAGDASVAMWVLFVANLINIVLDPLLIYGAGPIPALGVEGAAVATTIGRGTGVVIQIVLLARGRRRIRIRREHLRLQRSMLASLVRLSSPAVLQFIINTTSWVGVVYLLSGFGKVAVAGNTIGIRIIVFALLPSWGMANAAATMVGQNLGARRPDRAERAVWIAGFYNMIFLGAIGGLFVFLAEPLVRFFTSTSDPDHLEVLRNGTDCLRIVALGFLFYAYGMVFGQAFNGAGDTWTPTFMNLGCFWALELPLAWLLSTTLGLGPRGIFIAIAIAFSSLAVVGGIMFKKGRWKRRVV